MRTKLFTAIPVAVCLSCGGHSQRPAASAPSGGIPQPALASQVGGRASPERIAADARRATSAGVAYTAPAGWTSIARGTIVILTAQEGDAHLALVDATAPDPDAAVAEAWKLYRAAPPPALKLAVESPARKGWDQVREYAYEASPNEKRVVWATALRHGKAWAITLLDAARATLERRGAQFGLVRESVRPAAYARESFKGKSANKLDAARLAKIDALIERGRELYGVPGVAIAIVQDGKLIAAKGYGVRELGKKAPVDANSLFMIASNTKALSTLLLAELVDGGKLTWEQPVTEVYPDFKLGNAATTASTRIEHLVCACTGLPRKDLEFVFEFAQATPLTEMARLAGVQPTTEFGETFQYSNLLAGAAGFTAAHVIAPKQELGKAYDAAMKARILDPLGMNATTFDFKRALAANHASPHGWDIDGKTHVSPIDLNYSVYAMRPAGGAWSSASDLIKYVQLELNLGITPNGKRIVSEQNLLKRRAKYVAVGESGHYGMGLSVDETYFIPVVEHGGGIRGFRSNMLWLPDHGVGAVILTNSDLGGAIQAEFRRYLLEQLFDGKPEAIENIESGAAIARQSLAKERARLSLPANPEAVAGLAPHYANEALGTIDVSTRADVTTFDFGEWKSTVASRKNDDGTLSFITITPGRGGFQFVVAKTAGGKRQLIIREAQHEYVFVEAAK